MNLVILVVVYQLSPKQSATICSLSQSAKLLSTISHHIILRDNSSKPYGEIEKKQLHHLMEGLNVTYWHDGQNISLSQIYNRVIQKEIKETDYLVLLDHDSSFDSNYFQAFLHAKQQAPNCLLFLPMIQQGEDIISPSNVFLFKGSYWKKKRYGLVSTHHHTSINSGMIISGHYLLKQFLGYDEKLRFYNTDNYFMWKFSQQESFFFVLDYTVHHTLNFYDPSEPFEKKKARYQEMRKSAIYLAYLKSPILAFLTYLYYDIFSIKCCILNKESRFLFLR